MDIYTGAGVISGGSYSGGMVFSFSAVTTTLTTGIAAGTGFDQNYEGGVLTGGAFTEAGTAAGVTARVISLILSLSLSAKHSCLKLMVRSSCLFKVELQVQAMTWLLKSDLAVILTESQWPLLPVS